MSEKPKRKRCPNGMRKDPKTGECKSKGEKPSAPKKQVKRIVVKKKDPVKKIKIVKKNKLTDTQAKNLKKYFAKINPNQEFSKSLGTGNMLRKRVLAGEKEFSDSQHSSLMADHKRILLEMLAQKNKKKPPKKIVEKKVMIKSEPPKQRRRRQVKKDAPKPPKDSSPIKKISDDIKLIGSEFFGTLPKRMIDNINTNLNKILDSDIPFNVTNLRNRFQKEVKESIGNLRKLREGLGKVTKGIASKEEESLSRYKIQFALLNAIKELLDTFDNSNQFVRDQEFNYYIEATKLDESTLMNTKKILKSLVEVDNYENDKKYFGKPTEEQKDRNRRNMDILKSAKITRVYGIKGRSVVLHFDAKSKTWKDAYEKLFKTKRFELNETLIDQPYQKALQIMKRRLGNLYGREILADKLEDVEDDDLE
tara:strand:+ start:1417 stop:2679 length:1263 start_codon:yes stop_codon:yes gene_type:complete